jgi:DNA ligase-associated metallophosphoesterase
MQLSVKGQTLHLHPLKAIFWEEKQTLFLADLHLGKAAHFRKKGLAVPAQVLQTNLENIRLLLEWYSPNRVLFLGDLFHSTHNPVWEELLRFLETFPEVSFELVKGNHDILPPAAYENSLLRLHKETLTEEPFIFSHHPLDTTNLNYFNFYGHLHPGVMLAGPGKQTLKLACFHFGQQQAVLPAFGAFTGLAIVTPAASDRVFVVAEGEVLEVGGVE